MAIITAESLPTRAPRRPTSRYTRESPRRELEVKIPKEAGYFRNSPFTSFVRHNFVLPRLNKLARVYTREEARALIANSGSDARAVIDSVTTSAACEVLYRRAGKWKQGASELENFVFNSDNARAMPNRLKLVRSELVKELEQRASETRGTIKIASIAAGSAQAVLEAVSRAKLPAETRLELTFIDVSDEALDSSKKLAEKLQIKHPVKHIRALATDYLRKTQRGGFDVVEMVGLADYLRDREAEFTFGLINRSLSDNGTLISGNILPNPEKEFVTNAVGWDKMHYRTSRRMAQLVANAGFPQKNIQLFEEPLRVHGVFTARKQPED